MIDLELTINYCSLSLGDILNSEKLKECNLKKAGFFSRLVIPHGKRDLIYWSKNPTIAFLDGAEIMMPELSRQSGIEIMCGTTVYCFMETTRKVHRFICQTIGSSLIAPHSFKELIKAFTIRFGDPSEVELNVCSWYDEDSQVIVELNKKQDNLYVHWLLN